MASYFLFLYVDSTLFTNVISHFFDEFFGSWTAWLGCILVAFLLPVEMAVVDGWKLFKKLRGGTGTRVVALSTKADKEDHQDINMVLRVAETVQAGQPVPNTRNDEPEVYQPFHNEEGSFV